MNTSKKQARVAKAQSRYDAALAQAQAVPSGYTKRELKLADRALKAAQGPLWPRVVAAGIVGAATLAIVVSCSANAADDQREADRCVATLKATLREAGSDRPLRAEEVAACHDADKRAFILGGE